MRKIFAVKKCSLFFTTHGKWIRQILLFIAFPRLQAQISVSGNWNTTIDVNDLQMAGTPGSDVNSTSLSTTDGAIFDIDISFGVGNYTVYVARATASDSGGAFRAARILYQYKIIQARPAACCFYGNGKGFFITNELQPSGVSLSNMPETGTATGTVSTTVTYTATQP